MQTYRSRTPAYSIWYHLSSNEGEIAAHVRPDPTVKCRSEMLRTHRVATKEAEYVS